MSVADQLGTRLAPLICDDGARSVQARDADRKREKQQDMQGWRQRCGAAGKMVAGTDRNRVKERGAGSRGQEEARGWVGWGQTKETEREKEANQKPERMKGSRQVGLSLLMAAVPGWVLASSEPLLKLLHVGA